MNEIVARKILENGEEIIELDLNKPWPKRAATQMDEMEKIYSAERRKRRPSNEFITLLN